MNCKANWDRGILVDTLNKSFVDGKYSKSRRAILFQREQARFPDTMDYVEFATEGNAVDFGDLNNANNPGTGAGCSNAHGGL